MRMRLVSFTVAVGLALSILGFRLLEDQPVDDTRLLKSLEEFVALKNDEVPGFLSRSIQTHREQSDKLSFTSDELYQALSHKDEGVPGRDPAEILVSIWIVSDRDSAYEAAVLHTMSTFRPIGQPGMGEGSWTGLPIGEKSWAGHPLPGKGGGSYDAKLVVWDDRVAMKVHVQYPPVDPKARNLVFYPIEQSDLELGEMAARLILAKAHYLLLDGNNLPSCAVEVNGSAVSGRQTREGVVLVPVKPVLERLGGRVEDRLGVLRCAWQGKEVTLPLGARVALVGSWKVQTFVGWNARVRRLSEAEQVSLSLPVVYDGRQAWVDARGLATALGLRIEQRGNTLVLVAQ